MCFSTFEPAFFHVMKLSARQISEKHYRFVMCTLKFGIRPSPRLCIAMCAGVVFWIIVSFMMVPLMRNCEKQFRFLRRVGSLAAVLRVAEVNGNNHVESY